MKDIVFDKQYWRKIDRRKVPQCREDTYWGERCENRVKKLPTGEYSDYCWRHEPKPKKSNPDARQ